MTDTTQAGVYEPEAMTAEEWNAGGYYCVKLTADPGRAEDAKQVTAGSYDEYIALREAAHGQGLYIVSESFMTKEQYFPGLLTYSAAVDIFESANDKYIEFKSFPEFSKVAKIGVNDSVVLAADTGGGKSSLAINLIDDLIDNYPVLYFNLEMKEITVLRRLVSIHSGLTLDQIEGYKNDPQTAQKVKDALKDITERKPLQVISDTCSLEDVEALVLGSTRYRGADEPTIVIIDHSLLIKDKEPDRYKRFTAISEKLHDLANHNNIIIFSLLQQNRTGKKSETESPKNDSLKESGSWENDATRIVFLWWDPTANCKKLLITKNRDGKLGSFVLDYNAQTQKYREQAVQPQTERPGQQATAQEDFFSPNRKKTPREKRREKLDDAVSLAYMKADVNSKITLYDIAEAGGVSVSTIRNWMKEAGGYTINGVYYDPAGIDDIVEGDGFTRPSQIEEQETPKDLQDF